MDLDAGHVAPGGEGGGEHIVQDDGGGADQHDLSGEGLGGQLAGDDPVVRDGGEGAGAAAEVDEHGAPSRQPRRRDPRLLSQAIELEVEPFERPILKGAGQRAAAHEGIGVDLEVHEAEARCAVPDRPDGRVEVFFHEARLLHHRQRGGQHHVAGPRHGLRQRLVVGGAAGGGLGEDQIQADSGGPGGAQPIQQLTVQLPRPRPGQIQLVEGVLVDGDDHDGRGRVTASADGELGVEGLELGHLEQAEGIDPRGQRHAEPDEGTRQQETSGRAEEAHRTQPSTRPRQGPRGGGPARWIWVRTLLRVC